MRQTCLKICHRLYVTEKDLYEISYQGGTNFVDLSRRPTQTPSLRYTQFKHVKRILTLSRVSIPVNLVFCILEKLKETV